VLPFHLEWATILKTQGLKASTNVVQLYDFSNNWRFWFFFKFQNQRIVGSGFLRKNQNQGIAGFGYFRNIKELALFVKEPAMDW
jgi:hypothetical protein